MTLLLGIFVGWLLGNVKPPQLVQLLRPSFWRRVQSETRWRTNAARCTAGDHVEHTTEGVYPYNNQPRGWCAACERGYYLDEYRPVVRTPARRLADVVRHGPAAFAYVIGGGQ